MGREQKSDETDLAGNSFEFTRLWEEHRSAIIWVLAFLCFVVLVLLYNSNLWKESEHARNWMLTIGAVVGAALLFHRNQALHIQAKVAESGHVTDRFTAAIDQLGSRNPDGSPNLEVRLGAIYALESIARESDEYHWSVMEVLTAYIRTNATQPEDWKDMQGMDSEERKAAIDALPPLRVDLQAIVTVIGRREMSKKEKQLDFSRAWLSKGDFTGGTFNGALFVGANCEQANFHGAHCEGARFTNARCEGADFTDAILDVRTNFLDADLAGVRGLDLDKIKTD